MIIPNIWENKKCSKPPTSSNFVVQSTSSCTRLGWPTWEIHWKVCHFTSGKLDKNWQSSNLFGCLRSHLVTFSASFWTKHKIQLFPSVSSARSLAQDDPNRASCCCSCAQKPPPKQFYAQKTSLKSTSPKHQNSIAKILSQVERHVWRNTSQPAGFPSWVRIIQFWFALRRKSRAIRDGLQICSSLPLPKFSGVNKVQRSNHWETNRTNLVLTAVWH